MSNKQVCAVVLAAGNSSRMGRSKMALRWGKSTVLESTITHVQQAGIRQLLLITGGYHDLVDSLPGAQQISRVYNPNYAQGEILSSVKLALTTILDARWRADGVLVIPGDMPLITADLIEQCVAEWEATPECIVAPRYEGQRGHPVIFPFDLFKRFETLPAEKSPRDLIKAESDRFRMFDVENRAILIDIDTPTEYEKHRPQ